MSTASSPAWTSDTDPAIETAAVLRGVALIGVLKGFTRGVFGLGRLAKAVMDRLSTDGANPYADDASFDLPRVINLLQRALHLADALRARLRTPAVALALLRRPRATPIPRRTEHPAEKSEIDWADPLMRIAHMRADAKTRAKYRKTIADRSDAEVLGQIYSDLVSASAMLGASDAAARIAVLAHKAATLVVPVAEEPAPVEVVADDVVSAPADRAMAYAGADAHGAADDGPRVRAVGRGPP